jgi:Thiolase, N-terminal domain
VKRLCGSGLPAVISAAQTILLGDANAAVAGGAENMSRAPSNKRRWTQWRRLVSVLEVEGSSSSGGSERDEIALRPKLEEIPLRSVGVPGTVPVRRNRRIFIL